MEDLDAAALWVGLVHGAESQVKTQESGREIASLLSTGAALKLWTWVWFLISAGPVCSGRSFPMCSGNYLSSLGMCTEAQTRENEPSSGWARMPLNSSNSWSRPALLNAVRSPAAFRVFLHLAPPLLSPLAKLLLAPQSRRGTPKGGEL